jgi:hypothetical protein
MCVYMYLYIYVLYVVRKYTNRISSQSVFYFLVSEALSAFYGLSHKNLNFAFFLIELK